MSVATCTCAPWEVKFARADELRLWMGPHHADACPLFSAIGPVPVAPWTDDCDCSNAGPCAWHMIHPEDAPRPPDPKALLTPEHETCKCHRFYARTPDYAWDDGLGWRHTQARCGPVGEFTVACQCGKFYAASEPWFFEQGGTLHTRARCSDAYSKCQCGQFPLAHHDAVWGESTRRWVHTWTMCGPEEAFANRSLDGPTVTKK